MAAQKAPVEKTYRPIVAAIIARARSRTVLDLPSGDGWLLREVGDLDATFDGIDLYDDKPGGYREFWRSDLDRGIPEQLPRYDAIVSCEGIEHIANPGLLLTTARDHLEPGGIIVVTTPNVWYPGARMQYFLRGFFPSFPSLIGRIRPGTHMHVMPWSWPHLHLHLALAGFTEIALHPCLEPGRTRWIERLMAVPMRAYCRNRQRRAQSTAEAEYWQTCGQDGALLARRLVVSGRKPSGPTTGPDRPPEDHAQD
jgi:SAM-dependent methyltransferase